MIFSCPTCEKTWLQRSPRIVFLCAEFVASRGGGFGGAGEETRNTDSVGNILLFASGGSGGPKVPDIGRQFDASFDSKPLRTCMNHAATLLSGGQILVEENCNGCIVQTSESFDPSTDFRTYTGDYPIVFRARAVLLPNGIVFSAAGLQRLNTRPFGTIVAALWSAISGTCSTTGSLSHGRYSHTLTLLHKGKVLAARGLTFDGRYIERGVVYPITFAEENRSAPFALQACEPQDLHRV